RTPEAGAAVEIAGDQCGVRGAVERLVAVLGDGSESRRTTAHVEQIRIRQREVRPLLPGNGVVVDEARHGEPLGLRQWLVEIREVRIVRRQTEAIWIG